MTTEADTKIALPVRQNRTHTQTLPGWKTGHWGCEKKGKRKKEKGKRKKG